MTRLPTPHPPGIKLVQQAPSEYVPFDEITDDLGNHWWLIDDQWLLIFGQRCLMVEALFYSAAGDLVKVNGLLYRQVKFRQCEEYPDRVGYLEVEE